MTYWRAIILGIVQGLTEFLPISSTAHLRIVPALLGWEDPGAAFSAVIQIGTLVAVVAYFWTDLVRIGQAWVTNLLLTKTDDPARMHDARMGWMMIVATVPIVVAGLVFKEQIKTNLRSLYVISGALAGLSLLLVVAERRLRRREAAGLAHKQLADVSFRDAVIVGLAQAVALVPGSSRSGTTITAGLFLNLSREAAARLSFLLSLPAILAAGLYELVKERDELLRSTDQIAQLLVSTLVAGVVGYASIALLLRYLRTHSTYLFIFYRLALAAFLVFCLQTARLSPQDTPSEPATTAAQATTE